MPLTRREFLAGAGGLAGAAVFGVTGPAFGAAPVDPRTATRNRLVVIFLDGGNDGLNTVVPRGDVAGAPRLSVYRRVRPTLAYKPGQVLALDRGGDADHLMGFNPRLRHLHALYREGRVAVVQGVDYPNHNFSHFASADIWHTGDPSKTGASGWLGRHLDRAGVGDGELRAVAITPRIPLMLQGRVPVAAMTSIGAMRFRDGASDAAKARHRALGAMAGGRAGDPTRQRVGASLRQAVEVVDELAKTTAPKGADTPLANSLLTARTLLEQNLGVECVYVNQGGYDTHTTQTASHERLLGELDAALETFWLGTVGGVPVGTVGAMQPAVAARTLVMIVSEFGRRIGEAGGVGLAGTDHGAAAPVLLVGPPAATRPDGAASLVAGLHGDHPAMGTPNNTADNLVMTTDLRHVYQAVLQSWLGSPDPIYTRALPGLFVGGGAAGGAAAGRRGSITSSRTLDATATSSASLDAPGSTLPSRVAAKSAERSLLGGDGRAVHPVSAAAALAFNAFVAAIVLRSGKFRAAVAGWRDNTTAS